MSEISSGLVAVAWIAPDEDRFRVRICEDRPTDAPLWSPMCWVSDAEAIIAQKDAEIERLKQTPTIEDAKTTVEHLRAYAADNGYSHGDYADVMTEAANQIEKQAERIKELESEVLEQCRLNGMGAEREATLIGKVAQQSAALKLARQVLMSVKETSSSTRLRRIVDEPLAAIHEVLKGE